jgi:putative ABC transport system permease protein
MTLNYVRIAFRNLMRGKAFSLINIGGLGVGMAVAMLIGLWVYDELSFDRSHSNFRLIAQVMQNQTFNGERNTMKAIPMPLAAALRNDYPADFEFVVLSSWTNPHALSYKEKRLMPMGNFMEPGACEMLSLKMISGSGSFGPSSILLSESLAGSLFGKSDPLGHTVVLDKNDLQVTGVYEDLPYNTTLNKIAFIAPWSVYVSSAGLNDSRDNWDHNSFQLFVQVKDGKNLPDISAKIKNIKQEHTGDQGALKPEIFLYPMSRWHLYEGFKDGVNTGGKIEYVWMFGIIGVFVLLLACINFMNLSTARSEKRSKEVGIRKSIGSLRRQLVVQFYTESLLFAMVAFVFSLILVQASLPFFNELVNKKLNVPFTEPSFLLLGIAFTVVTGLIAGSYPALYLSSFQPVKVLKGTFKAGPSAAIPRKVLVVLQFSVSVVLVICTLIVSEQIRFAKSRPLGYNYDNLIVMRPFSANLHDHLGSLTNDLLQSGMVVSVAEGSAITKGSRSAGGFDWKGKERDASYDFMTFGASYEFGKTIDWEFIAGRDFSEKFPADSSALILNEAAVRYMGLKDPVGEVVTWNKPYTIIGVTKDIVMGSPFEPAKPTIYYLNSGPDFLYVKINPDVSVHDALIKIEETSRKYAPNDPFEYKFVDDEYAGKFGSEERIGKLANVSAVLTLFISCLGLFGMSSFMTEQRTKEIGIRKVLGASAFDLWHSLSKEFGVLVLLALLVAMPVAYYWMHNWLQNYEYRINLSLLTFAIAGFGTQLVAMLTVSFQTIRTALANPVKSLRSE